MYFLEIWTNFNFDKIKIQTNFEFEQIWIGFEFPKNCIFEFQKIKFEWFFENLLKAAQQNGRTEGSKKILKTISKKARKTTQKTEKKRRKRKITSRALTVCDPCRRHRGRRPGDSVHAWATQETLCGWDQGRNVSRAWRPSLFVADHSQITAGGGGAGRRRRSVAAELCDEGGHSRQPDRSVGGELIPSPRPYLVFSRLRINCLLKMFLSIPSIGIGIEMKEEAEL
jgi:hypothetical protein